MVVLCCTIQIPKFQILEKYVYNTNIMCLIQLYAKLFPEYKKKLKRKFQILIALKYTTIYRKITKRCIEKCCDPKVSELSWSYVYDIHGRKSISGKND